MEWYSGTEIQRLVTYDELIPLIEMAMVKFSEGSKGGVVQPVRMKVGVKESNGVLYTKPVYSSKDDVITTKIISRFPENVDSGLPILAGIIVLFDPFSGFPKAAMDAQVITGMRTAAASVVATKYLAPENTNILAIIGAGVQAVSHIEAHRALTKYNEIRIYSRSFSHTQNVANRYECIACMTCEEAVKDADVITTVTSSKTPVVMAEWVKHGAHINVVGGNQRDSQEIDPLLIKKADVYVDTREAALKESGDIIISGVDILGEIGEVIAGTIKADRSATTVFKSIGMAIEDAVSAKLVYDKKNKI